MTKIQTESEFRRWLQIQFPAKKARALELAEKVLESGFTTPDCALLQETLSLSPELFFPKNVAQFIADSTKHKPPKSLLDPCALRPGLLIETSRLLKPTKANGRIPYPSLLSCLKKFDSSSLISWLNKEQDQPLADFLICCPQWRAWESSTGNNELEPAELGLMLNSHNLVTDDASLVFVVNASIFERNNLLCKQLEDVGLFVNSIISIPLEMFSSSVNLAGLMIFLNKTPTKTVLVGELSADETLNAKLLKNMNEKKEGVAEPLGMIVEATNFHSYNRLVAERQAEKIGRRLGFSPLPLTDFVNQVNMGKSNSTNGFTDIPNCVYLPRIGNSPAVTSLTELRMKQQNYIQLVVNTKKCNSDYLAGFFNSTLGRKIRESALSGLVIPSISKAALTGAKVYLPEPELQNEIVSLEAKANDIITTLNGLKRNLWVQPRNAKEISKKIQTYSPREDLVAWIDTLPFPLASILWTYEAAGDTKDKVEALFHFFEALTQFHSTILLSAVTSDEEFFGLHGAHLSENDPQYTNWYLRPGFGHWLKLNERLAKFVRSILSKTETRSQCLKLFCGIDTDLLAVLTDKSILGTLESVREFRNKWKGHGGKIGGKQASTCLAQLEQNLFKIRKVMVDFYQLAQLVSPSHAEFTDEIFSNKCRLLTGRTTTFKIINIQSLHPLDKQYLYFFPQDSLSGIKLIPFFRLMASPKTEQNACYFYNSCEGSDKIRWVSYHFESEAELINIEEVASVRPMFRFLQPACDSGEPN